MDSPNKRQRSELPSSEDIPPEARGINFGQEILPDAEYFIT